MSSILAQHSLAIANQFTISLMLAILLSNSTILITDYGGLSTIRNAGLLVSLIVSITLMRVLAHTCQRSLNTWLGRNSISSGVIPLSLLLHGLADGLALGTAWSLGKWQGLVALSALLLHEIPHLWAQYRIWKLALHHTRRLVIWLVSLIIIGLLVGVTIHRMIDNEANFSSEFHLALAWSISCLLLLAAVWLWNHHFGHQSAKKQIYQLLIIFLFAWPLAYLHLVLHPHAH